MVNCAIKSCRNYKHPGPQKNIVSFHHFPRDPVIAGYWTKQVRLSRNENWWTPSMSSMICSAHFKKEDMYATKTGRMKVTLGAIPLQETFGEIQKNNANGGSPTEFQKPDIENKVNALYQNQNILQEALQRSNIDLDTNKDITTATEAHSPAKIASVYIANEKPPSPHTKYKKPKKTSTAEDDFCCSEDEAAFDSPRCAKLRMELQKKAKMQKKHVYKIKSLQRRNHRLKNKILRLAQTCKILKKAAACMRDDS